MNYLVIGDVHGCYYTFNNLITKHWNKENEVLIQLEISSTEGRIRLRWCSWQGN
jgi:hypothetical protein